MCVVTACVVVCCLYDVVDWFDAGFCSCGLDLRDMCVYWLWTDYVEWFFLCSCVQVLFVSIDVQNFRSSSCVNCTLIL